jgi:hypothetical protein
MAIETSRGQGDALGVGEIRFDMFPGARDMRLIAGFAVAQQEGGLKVCEDARVALGASG